jgi:hypothetical protein
MREIERLPSRDDTNDGFVRLGDGMELYNRYRTTWSMGQTRQGGSQRAARAAVRTKATRFSGGVP